MYTHFVGILTFQSVALPRGRRFPRHDVSTFLFAAVWIMLGIPDRFTLLDEGIWGATSIFQLSLAEDAKGFSATWATVPSLAAPRPDLLTLLKTMF